jgi:hypothetical protein
MKTGDEKAFREIVRYLSLNFPEREVGADLVRSYFYDLDAFGIEEVREAAKAHVLTGDRFPFVSDLVRAMPLPAN